MSLISSCFHQLLSGSPARSFLQLLDVVLSDDVSNRVRVKIRQQFQVRLAQDRNVAQIRLQQPDQLLQVNFLNVATIDGIVRVVSCNRQVLS